MDAPEAQQMYERLYQEITPQLACLPSQPLNKQKNAMKAPAFFTCMINLLFARSLGERCCNYNPLSLTSFTQNRCPIRTLSRRVDGAFPSPQNPLAIWEIKEYYYTTTFGSRIADGVYESLLDGFEINEAKSVGVNCKHYLFVDAKFTWWGMGKSYLCRLIDMMHMGYVDEVIFGREIEYRIPKIVESWNL